METPFFLLFNANLAGVHTNNLWNHVNLVWFVVYNNLYFFYVMTTCTQWLLLWYITSAEKMKDQVARAWTVSSYTGNDLQISIVTSGGKKEDTFCDIKINFFFFIFILDFFYVLMFNSCHWGRMGVLGGCGCPSQGQTYICWVEF